MTMARATQTRADRHEADDSTRTQARAQPAGFDDRRSTTVAQRRLADLAVHGPRAAAQLTQRAAIEQREARSDRSGLPDALKSGIENLSGMSMAGVRVHYNSARPAGLNAHAYAQGEDIHLGPGQEHHLPHEAWHVVQQRQGRVTATMQMAGVGVNDDAGLEREADAMGARALSAGSATQAARIPGMVQSAASTVAVAQMVRQKIPPQSKDAITLNTLRQLKAAIDIELGQSQEEATGGYFDQEKINRWLGDYDAHILTLERLVRDDELYSWEQLQSQATAAQIAMRKVAITLGKLGKALNDSFDAYTSAKEAADAESAMRAAYADKKTTGKPRVKAAPEQTPTKGGPIGLQTKWGKHRESLEKLAGNTIFVQLVPQGAETAEKALKSQNILDAVYHDGKAFWMAAEASDYRLAASAGKVLMRYTFTTAGAKSLMHDYLICGSGDYADDNEEQWQGEAAHPNYTIWKTNEVGAFGVGANRLKQLAAECTKIEVVAPQSRK